LIGHQCVIRIRYNVSTTDFKAGPTGSFIDSTSNCNTNDVVRDPTTITTAPTGPKASCKNVLSTTNTPLFDRPYVELFSDMPLLSITVKTNQSPRTFQDRSYVFKVAGRPAEVGAAKIYNLNARGRRGNIQQCYPAVEKDFSPNDLTVTTNDYVHVQFCGSDFSADNNNGEGWRYSDRTNMVQVNLNSRNFPAVTSQMTMFDTATAKKMAFAGLDVATSSCNPTYLGANGDQNQNAIDNCGKLNSAPALFDGGLVKFSAGYYQYISTRHNDFSNRSTKGKLTVLSSLSAGAVAGIVVGSVLGASLVGLGGAIFFARRFPNSRFAQRMNRVQLFSPHTVSKTNGFA